MVRSLDRGIDVLVLLGRSRAPMALPEITAALQLPRTTAFNLVRTLARRGAVESAGPRGYRLGPLVSALAEARLPPKDLITRVRSHLERLTEQTGETALLSVPSGDEIVFIDRVESPQAVRYTVQVGTRRPMYCSAHGKAALSRLAEPALQAYLARTTLTPHTDRTRVDPVTLRADLARAREQGFAVSDGEFIADVFSLSAPLGDAPGSLPLGMISVVGPASRVRPRCEAIGRLLADTAAAATADCRGLQSA